MTCNRNVSVFALPILLAVPVIGRAGELAGSVTVRNGIVHVEVEDDGKPAVGVKVHLREVRKKEIIAQGKINAEGQWSWPLLKAGSYEVVIEQPGQEPLVWPVDQREKVDPTAETDAKKCPHHVAPAAEPVSSLPWLPTVLGSMLVSGCGLVLWFSKWKRR